MKKEEIKSIKSWPKLRSVKNISLFLDFSNFYEKLIKNFTIIAISLILMLWTTDKTIQNEIWSPLANKNWASWKISNITNDFRDIDSINGDMEYLLSNEKFVKKLNLAKPKKTNFTKSKNSDLVKAKNFAIANFSKIDFLTSKAK